MDAQILDFGNLAYVLAALAITLPGISRILELFSEGTTSEIGGLLSAVATWLTCAYSFVQWDLVSAGLVFLLTRFGRISFATVYELYFNARHYGNIVATFTRDFPPPPLVRRHTQTIEPSSGCLIHLNIPARNKENTKPYRYWSALREAFEQDPRSGLTKRSLGAFDWNLYRGPRILRGKQQVFSEIHFSIECVSLPEYASLLEPESLTRAARHYIESEFVESFRRQDREDRVLKQTEAVGQLTDKEYIVNYSQHYNVQDNSHFVELAQFVALDSKEMLVFRIEYFRENEEADSNALAAWRDCLQSSWRLDRQP